ncbi:hypothetical protein [Chitinophaga arvensicola]|uniref:Uncharacterized protein n=1 Tax=Chitinophaga arvensicola TaxID=29529 RepID=A0A1I0P544_9BACT|nr:hypothetical protein [Chitinophaga arvensicola]SEW09450.1 hypothetical protein SAMN04488122_0567 [Chitinophaga arvensicola]
MKQLTAILIITILAFQACKPSAGKQPEETATINDSAVRGKILDTYKGDFGNAPIYITLNYLNHQHIAGYNVHKGLRRNLHGELKKDNNNWIVTLSEPGDHPFDGKFVITFDSAFNAGKGTWTPLNTNTLKEKSFDIQRNSGYGQQAAIAAGTPTFDAFFMDEKFYKSDFAFKSDGSCLLQLYEQVNDSTLADQLLRIRGTYERTSDSTVKISWEKNTHFKEPNIEGKLSMHHEEDGSEYITGLTFEDLRFVTGP